MSRFGPLGPPCGAVANSGQRGRRTAALRELPAGELVVHRGHRLRTAGLGPLSEARRGDILFWGPDGSQHEALYLGEGQMLEAQQNGVPVKVSPVRRSGMTPYVTRVIEY